MEQVFKDTKLNENDWVLIKHKKPSFNDFAVDLIGVLRDYDNKNSLSGCIKKFYKNFKISGIVKEYLSDDISANHKVFCWYKKGFIVLCDEHFAFTLDKKLDTINYVNIFKLNNEEVEKFKMYVIKTKILDGLKEKENEKGNEK